MVVDLLLYADDLFLFATIQHQRPLEICGRTRTQSDGRGVFQAGTDSLRFEGVVSEQANFFLYFCIKITPSGPNELGKCIKQSTEDPIKFLKVVFCASHK